MRRLDLTGQRFGRLVALGIACRNAKGRILWRCRCDCGNETRSKVDNLTRGIATSCGCLNREKASKRAKLRNTTHGHTCRGSASTEYRTWCSMLQRCKYPYTNDYERYGGRGIKVCERWQSFENFLSDMGLKPTPKHSIDRQDIDGHYEPGNCRWATIEEQANNKSNTRWLEVNGQRKSLTQWARERGISAWVISGRLKKGWSPHDSVMRPLMKVYKHRETARAK